MKSFNILFTLLLVIPAVDSDSSVTEFPADKNFTAFSAFNNSFTGFAGSADDDEDSSGLGSDGPVIIYENGGITCYSVISEGREFKIKISSVSREDIFSCHIDETNTGFSFRLKDTITTEPDEYELPGKMLIISDIEGNFRGFSEILTGTGVTDRNFNWIFGDGHLVLPGDFFDRGINVTECLWLIYKLENEALLHGGKVHFILGNHEMMNLKERFKYVRKKYFVNADTLGLEYSKWYSPDSELGRWLRSKNCVEKIGDFLFLHAGISKDFPHDEITLSEINENTRERIERVFIPGETSKDIYIGNDGPLWYRDIVLEKETQDDVERTLKSYNSSKMIVGHTIVDSIKYLYNQSVIAVDLYHQENSDKGIMLALWFENGMFYTIDNNGNRTELK